MFKEPQEGTSANTFSVFIVRRLPDDESNQSQHQDQFDSFCGARRDHMHDIGAFLKETLARTFHGPFRINLALAVYTEPISPVWGLTPGIH